MKHVIVIPARYESSRLPGKPLIELCGVPMVVRTYRQCAKACSPEKIFVATEDVRIKEVCDHHGIQVLMTSGSCLTGTDRVAECAQKIDADVFINVQGDEPIFDPQDVSTLVAEAQKSPGEVLNGVCELENEADYRSGNVPKVVIRPDGKLLYMSRAAIPSNKNHRFVKAWRQVCAYAFPKRALEAFSGNGAKTPLEEIEDIEILRLLELGWQIRMVPLSRNSVPVDTPDDVEKVNRIIQERGY